MNPALLVSKTGLQAQEAKLQVIAHNLANVNTVGFKRNSAAFEDQFYEIARMPGSNSQGDNRVPAGVQLGTGVRLASTHKQFTEGSLQNTSQQLDVAIVGNGFLQVLQANGDTAYTRAGQLQVDNEGRLVNANGLPLQPEITIPEGAKSVTISATGLVSAMVGTDATPRELGTLQLATFVNPAGLQAQGDNLYLVTQASGDAVLGAPGEAGFGTLRQYALESSNVQAVEEMVDMISAQRSYEMSTKVLSAADDMMRNLAQAA
ncbi:flagellar basal-body rod protein FlgG [Comamonas guangdongensis]|uniref:Flagellar basal-body rod protein FlgG n=1 Tax=Comamonas guangdongensis TaxID=510515 RepID=A0ABV3ZRQ0_9BURK